MKSNESHRHKSTRRRDDLRREAPSAPPLGELLSEREAEGVRLDEWSWVPYLNRKGVCYVGALCVHRTTPPLRLAKSRLWRLLACIAPAGVSVSPFGLPAFNSGMIATGNHDFERFAALRNTPEVEPRALRAGYAQRRQKINGGGLLFIGGYDILDRKNKSEERLYGKA